MHSLLSIYKLAVDRKYWFSGLDPEVESIIAQALRKLQDAGATLIEAEMPDLARLVGLTTIPIQNHDVRQALSDYLEHYHAGVTFEEVFAGASADVRRDFAVGAMRGGPDVVTEEEYRQACDVYLPLLRRRYQEYFARTGAAAIIFPTTMVPAPHIGNDTELEVCGKTISFEVAVAGNIAPGSTGGVPGLVLPAGLTSGGLPVGIESTARPERTESHSPWESRSNACCQRATDLCAACDRSQGTRRHRLSVGALRAPGLSHRFRVPANDVAAPRRGGLR